METKWKDFPDIFQELSRDSWQIIKIQLAWQLSLFSGTYKTVNETIDSLSNKEVDAVFIDLYSLVSYRDALIEKGLKIKTLMETHTGYGLILSGNAQVLKNDFKDILFSRQLVISNYIKSIENDIPVRILADTCLGNICSTIETLFKGFENAAY